MPNMDRNQPARKLSTLLTGIGLKMAVSTKENRSQSSTGSVSPTKLGNSPLP